VALCGRRSPGNIWSSTPQYVFAASDGKDQAYGFLRAPPGRPTPVMPTPSVACQRLRMLPPADGNLAADRRVICDISGGTFASAVFKEL